MTGRIVILACPESILRRFWMLRQLADYQNDRMYRHPEGFAQRIPFGIGWDSSPADEAGSE